MYDLNLMPIHTLEGQMFVQLAGLHAAGPPRRAARSRSEDMLIMSLTTRGSEQVSPETSQAWLERQSQVFFKTSGSVTSALRTLIETLNLMIMEKNLKLAQNGGAMTGAINIIAIHRRNLYLAQSGLTHAYSLTHEGLQHFHDTSQNDRGLGVSRVPAIRYYQADLGTGGYVFMTDTPPDTWTDELLFSSGFPNFEQLRRRLLNQAPVNFRLGLVQIKPGDGQINVIQPPRRPGKPAEHPSTVEQSPDVPLVLEGTESPADEVVGESQEISKQTALSDQPEKPAAEVSQPEVKKDRVKSEPILDETQPVSGAHGVEVPSDDNPEPSPAQSRTSQRGQSSKETGKAAREASRFQKEQLREKGLKGMAAVVEWLNHSRAAVDIFFKDLFARWTPISSEGSPKISHKTLVLIAIAVPLVVTVIGVGVYLSRGKTLQYEHYFSQAEATSQIASSAEDPDIARSQWAQTLFYLDEADEFRETKELTALREEAQNALDVLDGAVRLAYQPAIIGSLYSEINITRIVSYGVDLYLLDQDGGRVIHATRTDQGYEVDPEFVCSPGNFDGVGVDMLVDMAPLPINNPFQAHILAVDALGNAAYCAPGQDPVVQSLPMPEGGAAEIRRIAYDSNYLYVLTPNYGTILVYRPTNGQFLDPPTDFFGDANNGERPDVAQIVDVAVNGSDLYLLRPDGVLINCVYSGLPSNPVICENPVDYIDGRPGVEEQVMVLPESNYVSIIVTSPPDPSISILDAQNADIYRFSLRFRLHQRLRPEMGAYEVDSPRATAFTIGIDRVAFIAFGHQVFYAYVD